MNKLFIVLCSVVMLLALFSFNKNYSEAKDIEAIGDVKYSILDPKQFRDENGDGWVLMDGGSSIETRKLFDSSQLHLRLGIASLPDARGIFIRGMNEGRDTNTGDVDGDRLAGNPQADAFQNHYHRSYMNEANSANSPGWGVTTINAPKNIPIVPEGGPLSNEPTREPISDGKNNPRVSSETRPRNITLYVYIKIN